MSVISFTEKLCDYALIIGVYNEGQKFSRQIEALQPYRTMVDILIADGNSNDGASSETALQYKARSLLINKTGMRGLSVQYRQALHFALEEGYAGVIMMDGNGKDGPDALPRFIEKLRDGYDFIQGSRFMRGGVHANTPLDRVFGIKWVFNPIINLGSPFHYTDGMNGFKACSRTLLEDPRIAPFRTIFVRYNLQYYLNYRAPRLGFRVTEVPVSRSYPTDGTSYSKIVGLRARLRIIGELLSTVLGRYNP